MTSFVIKNEYHFNNKKSSFIYYKSFNVDVHNCRCTHNMKDSCTCVMMFSKESLCQWISAHGVSGVVGIPELDVLMHVMSPVLLGLALYEHHGGPTFMTNSQTKP